MVEALFCKAEVRGIEADEVKDFYKLPIIPAALMKHAQA
jgi:hypothetical protein